MKKSRQDFAKALQKLLAFAHDDCGFELVMDWLLRDAETQKRFYQQGKSKCDGYNRRSAHQTGKAIDIYIVDDGQISGRMADYQKLHDYWMDLGGEPMISWDMGHFEMR
jgi:D-alanyl-D-alanine dipeptidase